MDVLLYSHRLQGCSFDILEISHSVAPACLCWVFYKSWGFPLTDSSISVQCIKCNHSLGQLRRSGLSLTLEGFVDVASHKESTCQCRRCKRWEFNSWVRKIPWRREWLPTPVFLPGEFHGQRSPVDYSPWSCKESDMSEQMNTHTQTYTDTQTLWNNPSSPITPIHNNFYTKYRAGSYKQHFPWLLPCVLEPTVQSVCTGRNMDIVFVFATSSFNTKSFKCSIQNFC